MAEKTFKYKVVVDVGGGNQLKTLEDSLKKISKGYEDLAKKQKDAFSGVAKMAQSGTSGIEKMISSVKTLAVAMAALKGVAGALSLAFDFGKTVVAAAKFRQVAIQSIERFFPNRGKGIFKDTIDLANRTPADTKPLLDFQQQLVGTGINEEALKKLTLLRADVEAGGGSQSVLDNMATSFQAALGGGAPEVGGDFIQKFIGKTNWIRALAKQIGVANAATGNIATLEKAINDAKKVGKITGQEYANALTQATNDRLKQAKIGEISRSMATGSIAGAISNFSNVFDNMLLSQDLDAMPGIKALIKLLNQVTDILNGPAFQKGLEEIINNLFGGFEELVKNPQRIQQVMNGLLTGAKAVADVFGAIFRFITEIASAKSGSEALSKFIDGIAEALKKLGYYIGLGISAAIKGVAFGAVPVLAGGKTREEEDEDARKAEEQRQKDAAAFEERNKRAKDDAASTTLNEAAGVSTMADYGSGFGMGIHTNIVIHGNADPDKVKAAAESGVKSGFDKAAAKHQLRKAGKAK